MSCLPNWSDAGPRVLLDDEGLNLCAVSWQTLGFLGIMDGNADGAASLETPSFFGFFSVAAATGCCHLPVIRVESEARWVT